ncbi:hypothetical protein PAHAL_9G083500 [Panicum hallii]|uniref:Uncharacterized protein n=1 Tax=Panicum hallii TaxID=206008 RepID=A0A2T8I0Q4_9POAL|nr:hypothetical protein PAHAL_9G083500 [Panicum hallii]
MLQAFDIIELQCKLLIEHAKQLGKTTAPRWCGDLPELLLARTILEDESGSDFAAMAKEGTGIPDRSHGK